MTDLKSFTPRILDVFDNQWALLTAGTADKFNTMTIGWGGLGTLWRVPAATVYVRPERYTHEFMDANDYFTISFFAKEYHPALTYLGSHSGRDEDKLARTNLTPVAAEHGMTFKEAAVTLICRKMYKQELDPAAIPAEILKNIYEGVCIHTMYIGQVVGLIEGQEL